MTLKNKKHTEALVAITMLISYVALIAAIIIAPANIMFWGSLAIASVALMLVHLSYMPMPQNPYLGGLGPRERGAIENSIASGSLKYSLRGK